MKKLVSTAVLMVLAWATLAPATYGLTQPSDKEPQTRALTGLVTDPGGTPVNSAIVYLKNTKTMAVKTYITSQDGTYRFNALSPNVDYEVYAEHQGKKSDTKTLSSFDSRKTAYINLKIKG